jgi:4-hydroxybenzoate polyprenyltransferase
MEPRVAGFAAVVALILTLALSWLPYAIAFAFGMLPAVATLSASPPRWPAA